MQKVGRNDPCPCGSGRKYKQCCLQREQFRAASTHAAARQAALQIPAAIDAALAHHNAGRLPEAEAIYRQILQAEPHHPDALHLLGLIAHQARKSELAIDLISKAIKANPSNPLYYSNLGNMLKDQGKLEAAVENFRKAIALKPDYAEALSNLGNALQAQGRLDEATERYLEALSLMPDLVVAHNNLGTILQDQGQLDSAVERFRKVLALKPDFAEAHNNLGLALQNQGKLEQAVECYFSALALKPDFAEAHFNLGNTRHAQGQFDAAVVHQRKAIALKPDFAKAHCNLGSALRDLGRFDEAVACFHKALEIKPDFADAYSTLLYAHAFARDISPQEELALAADWEKVVLTESERNAARDRASPRAGFFVRLPLVDRKLRVGVVSAEFGHHAISEFLEPLLQELDRRRFHITLYPTAVRLGSRAARLRELADGYKYLVGLSDVSAADQIRFDKIDILIDTMAHMRGCRLGIFAHRAAPVQCHYIGYHGTTGLTEMDWFIADEVLLPGSCDSHFREGIWRLPRLWVAYRGDSSLAESKWRPDPEGTVWLGTFNNLAKVRDQTLHLWAKVMTALPQSRLLLKDRKAVDSAVQDRIRSGLVRHGISGKRVEFAGWVSGWDSHMALYDKLDIALDTVPVNSGTTAFDALWMGVPLVALEGDWMGGRMTSTMLKALGKPEWIAHSEEEYVHIASALAADVEGRKSLRATQRQLMAASPLCDAKDLARSLENAFEAMFDRWLAKGEHAFKGPKDGN